MPALVRIPPPSSTGQTISSSAIVGTGTRTSASWHTQATTGHQWSPLMPFHLQSTSQSSAVSAQTGISIAPASDISAQPSHQPGSTATNRFPQISADDTATMLFDQLTGLLPLFEAWLQGEVGSTGAVTDAIKIARDTALLTAYQSGGFMANSQNCDASLMDIASCIVRALVKAEEDLSRNSSGEIVKITKKLEKHQRSLLKVLWAHSGQQSSKGIQTTAPVNKSATAISNTSIGSGPTTMTSGSASVLAGSLASTDTGTLSSEAPKKSTEASTSPAVIPTPADSKTSGVQTSATADSSSPSHAHKHSWSAIITAISSDSSSAASPAGADTASTDQPSSTADSLLPVVVTGAPNKAKRDERGQKDAPRGYYHRKHDKSEDHWRGDNHKGEKYQHEPEHGWPERHWGENRHRPSYYDPEYHEPYCQEPHHGRPHHEIPHNTDPSPTSSGSPAVTSTSSGRVSQLTSSGFTPVTAPGSSPILSTGMASAAPSAPTSAPASGSPSQLSAVSNMSSSSAPASASAPPSRVSAASPSEVAATGKSRASTKAKSTLTKQVKTSVHATGNTSQATS